MVDRLNLTRDELASFLGGDHRKVKQFEKLFSTVDEIKASGSGGDIINNIEETLVFESSLESDLQKLKGEVDFLRSKLFETPDSRFIDYIQFKGSHPQYTQKNRIFKNSDFDFFSGSTDLGGYRLNFCGDLTFYAKNTSGSLLAAGTPVMATGTVGSSGALTVAPAVSDGSVLADYMVGVTLYDCPNNGFAHVSHFGTLKGIDTTGSPYSQTWSDGDLLYIDPLTPGAWTNVKPEAPALNNPIAIVDHAGSGGSGSIVIRMNVAQYLSRLSDVNIASSLSSGDLLIYDLVHQRWESSQLTAGSGITITPGPGSIEISSSVVSSLPLVSQYETPTTGFSIAVDGSPGGVVSDIWLIIVPAAGLASGTIVFPASADRVNHQKITIVSRQQVTSLAFDGNGATIYGAPPTIAAEGSMTFMYESPGASWYRIS